MEKREGMGRSEESYQKLDQMYKGAYAQKIPQPADNTEKEARQDPLYCAKKVVEDLIKMFGLASEEYKLSASEQIFVSELFRLNVQKAEDCPLTTEQVERIKGKASQYYEAGIKLLSK